jgi:hypothetical protein
MAILIDCPACRREIRAGRTLGGKRVRCPGCGEPVIIPTESSLSVPSPRSDDRRGVFTPVNEVHWDQGDFESLADANSAPADTVVEIDNSPVPWTPPPGEEMDLDEECEESPVSTRSESPEPSSVALSTLAFDATQIGFAIQWGLIWTLAVCAGGLASLMLSPLVLPLIVVPATWVCYMAAVSGIAYLASRKATGGRSPGWSDAWGFLARRSLSLVLGTVVIGLAAALGALLIYGIVFAVSHVPYVGSILGGVLVIPTFFLVLFTLGLVFNLYLLPIIIGVEDCSARTAFGYLWATVSRNSIALYGACFRALGSILPFAAFTGLLTAVGLGGAFVLCGGEQVLFLTGGVSLGGSLQLLSFLSLLAGYLGFVTAFATCGLTAVYCTHAVRSHE